MSSSVSPSPQNNSCCSMSPAVCIRRLLVVGVVVALVVLNDLRWSKNNEDKSSINAAKSSSLRISSAHGDAIVDRNSNTTISQDGTVEPFEQEEHGEEEYVSHSSSAVVEAQQYQEENKDSDDEHKSSSIPTGKYIFKESDFPPPPISPWEMRHPDQTLPKWATKPFFFRGVDVPSNKSVCFVHVGKTAGSSLGCSLGFKLHCEREMRYPAGVLSSYTTNMIHNGVNDCWDDMAYYMFTLRDPVERIKSWFAYERPGGASNNKFREDRERLFTQCPFPTLNILAEYGLGHGNGAYGSMKVSDTCRGRARRAIAGTERFGYHAFFNYQYYLSKMRKSNTITAVRQEHLVDDWNSMEYLLSGNKNVVDEFPRKNYVPKDPADEYLSDTARKLLCQYLCEDIQAYKYILFQAINLSPSQKESTMDELRASCPKEADLIFCPTLEGI